jgi:hypothetical protein
MSQINIGAISPLQTLTMHSATYPDNVTPTQVPASEQLIVVRAPIVTGRGTEAMRLSVVGVIVEPYSVVIIKIPL